MGMGCAQNDVNHLWKYLDNLGQGTDNILYTLCG